MSDSLNNNRAAVGDADSVSHEKRGKLTASPTEARIRHIYVHTPFCARICPYCAFYKELLDRSQTERFCEALLSELRQQALAAASPSGGGQDRPAFANGQSGSDLRRG